MEIIVGKQGQQPFAITEPTVSRRHVRITDMENGKYQIEDLGSANGTFVDGVRVIKKVVTENTVVQLGGNFTFRVGDAVKNMKPKADTSVFSPEEKQKFARLEKVYNDYNAAKVALQKDNAQKSFMRMLPMSIIGIAGVLISLVPGLESYRAVIICVGVCACIFLMYKAYNASTDLPMKMEALRRQFQIDYVCPRCKSFLGDIPFEGIKNKGKCSVCKTKWK